MKGLDNPVTSYMALEGVKMKDMHVFVVSLSSSVQCLSSYFILPVYCQEPNQSIKHTERKKLCLTERL